MDANKTLSSVDGHANKQDFFFLHTGGAQVHVHDALMPSQCLGYLDGELVYAA